MRNELVAEFSLIHVQTGLFIHYDMPFTNGQPERSQRRTIERENKVHTTASPGERGYPHLSACPLVSLANNVRLCTRRMHVIHGVQYITSYTYGSSTSGRSA